MSVKVYILHCIKGNADNMLFNLLYCGLSVAPYLFAFRGRGHCQVCLCLSISTITQYLLMTGV